MKRRGKAIKILAAVSSSLLLCSAVLAAYEARGRSINVLTTGTFSNKLVEEYQAPEHLNPGQSMDKVVNVTNDGGVDSFVRVKVTKLLGTRDGQGKLIKDEALDPELLEISYNTKYWKYRKDGFWYYAGILKAGETTKEPLFQKCSLSVKADNRYKNKDGEIQVALESIQAGGGALEALWKVKAGELGVKEGACRSCKTVTRVTLDPGYQIKIDASDADLFANFKNLLPGSARTQSIRVGNQSKTETQLFLRAEEAKQTGLTDKEKKLVKKLLDSYTFLEVRQGSRVLYQGPASGKGTGKNTSMKRNISLGTILPGKEKELAVTLSVSPQMGNSYQALTGKVDWIFTASGEEAADGGGDRGNGTGGSGGGSPSGSKGISEGKISPKTGDGTEVSCQLALLGISGLLTALILWLSPESRPYRKRS